MSARDELFRRVAGAFVDEAKANALIAARDSEVLRAAADKAELMNPDRSADFSEGVDWVLSEIRRMADEAAVS